MTPERWQRIKDLFNAAIDVPAGKRAALLDVECAGDEDLRREVESLISNHDADDQFLESSAISVLDLGTDESIVAGAGRMIGPYRVLRTVGSGGMGVVMEAERADEQFQKRVAIKLIKRGMDSDQILRRFRQERQILAALDHPNIARLLDGGVTADGQPYLVMEFIDGLPIHDYVRRSALSLEQTIGLFRDVCGAVHFAHQNLVVHRDLKPSNILVTDTGVVKLLDFGVAKLLKPDDSGGATLTAEGGRALTPAYASPEQLRGEPTTTASDVYSLGVTFYELLTGRSPFEKEPSYQQIVEQVLSPREPVRPSAALQADSSDQNSVTTTRALQRRLSGELDNIVLMAIRKERDRRYPSAAALSDDLGRYLDGHPVLAQQDTAGYRMRKFVQRHRVAVWAAAAVVVTISAGIAATLWQAREANVARAVAEQRLTDVRALTKTMIFDVYDAINDIPGSTKARELVVSRAFEYLDRLAADSRDPVLLREVVDAYIRLAAAQGQPAGANRGDIVAARKTLDRALTVASDLVALDSSDLKSVRALALVNEKLGDVQAHSGDVAGGVASARAALASFGAIARVYPDSVRAQLSVVISNIKLSDLLGNQNFPNLGDREGALAGYSTARDLLGRPPLAGSNDAAVRRYVGLVHERIGSLLEDAAEWTAAEAAYSQSLLIREQLSAESAQSTNAKRDVAVTLQNLCDVRSHLGQAETATSNCESARDIFVALHSADKDNVQSIDDLARIHASLARVADANDRLAAAIAELEQTVAIRETLFKAHPENTQNGRLLVSALLEIVPYHLRLAESGRASAADAKRKGLAAHGRAAVVMRSLAENGAEMAAERERLERVGAQLSRIGEFTLNPQG